MNRKLSDCYGNYFIEDLNKRYDNVLIGNITFKYLISKNNIDYKMNQFKNFLNKEHNNTFCYYVIEKNKNNENHVHLLLGIDIKDNVELDYKMNIFYNYWKGYGINLWDIYDECKGNFASYMLKKEVDWNFFETKFGNMNDNTLLL